MESFSVRNRAIQAVRSYRTPIRSLDDPHSVILGYNCMGSLADALQSQDDFSFEGEAQAPQQAMKKLGKRQKKGGFQEESDTVEMLETPEESISVAPISGIEWEEDSPAYHEPAQFAQADSTRPLLSRLLTTTDERVYHSIESLLQLIPDDIFSRCILFGSRLYILEKGKIRPELSALSGENLELPGGYVPRLRAGYIHKEALGLPTMQNLPLILLAHMYDHALGGDNFSSLKSPAVHSLYLACRQRKTGHQFMSGYSEAGPVQYFAQSMASYFSPEINNLLFTRQVLQVIDAGMYDYMRCLFGPV